MMLRVSVAEATTYWRSTVNALQLQEIYSVYIG